MRTDYGNAERLVHLHGQDLRYCHPFRKWYCWDGQRWRLDDSGGPTRAAKLTVRAIYAEAAEAEDETTRKALAAWAVKSEADSRIRAALSLATSEAAVVVLPQELDADLWLAASGDGTLDLRTGKLRDPDRGDYMTKLIGGTYDPATTCPRWDAFLKRIFDGDQALIGFVQRAVGYSLTGDISEHCLFICYGTGRNGKTVFLTTVRKLLGDYAQQLPRDTLLRRRGDQIPNDLARLAGARFATAIETRQGQRLDEELVKQLTGGDPISARFLHGEFFEFQPVAKIWLATNHKPRIDGTDEGIWSRIRLVPFTVTIPEGERDKHLTARLEQELPGILQWAVQGCLAWQQQGLDPPAAVTDATEGYRREEDPLVEFVDQCCVLGDHEYAYASDLADAYMEFTGQRISQQEFGKLLKDRGFDSTRTGHSNKRTWLGIGLGSDRPPKDDNVPL